MSDSTKQKFIFVSSGKRAVEKQIVSMSKIMTTIQTNSLLFTATYPCTLEGLRWVLSFRSSSNNNATTMWALVKVNEGSNIGTISNADLTSFYDPASNVLSFGTITTAELDVNHGPITLNDNGVIGTGRRFNVGDRLYFLALCNQANGNIVVGQIQFFCKF